MTLSGPSRDGVVIKVQEPCNGRLLRTVLWELGGTIPPGDPTSNLGAGLLVSHPILVAVTVRDSRPRALSVTRSASSGCAWT